jgi:hypothetical protein
MSTPRQWSITEAARTVHHLDISLDRVGDEQWVLCQSDVHWDNPHCDLGLFQKHLDEARAKDAPILDNGDFFCAMQGKFDKRASKNDLRPEHQRADYLDALIDTATDALTPYADLLTVRGQGNHETSIRKKHETDLTVRLVERLRAAGSSTVKLGGYSGYVVFRVSYSDTRRRPFKLFYHHGYGGGGPVTRGVITTNRQAAFLADADLVWAGHTHDSYHVPVARVRLNQDCTAIEHTQQDHLRTPGYKNEYADGYGGWHIERGGPPKPLGAKWIVFRHIGANASIGATRASVTYDILEAK